MKLWIVVVAVVATGSIWGADAYYHLFTDVTRAHIYSPENDMLSMDNYTERDTNLLTEITFKQKIDKDNNPMMIYATIINTNTSTTLLDGGPYNICEKQKNGTLDNFAVRFFQFFMIPKEKKKPERCPVEPSMEELFNHISATGITLDDKLDVGNYVIGYTAETSKNQPVISSMAITLKLEEPPSDNM